MYVIINLSIINMFDISISGILIVIIIIIISTIIIVIIIMIITVVVTIISSSMSGGDRIPVAQSPVMKSIGLVTHVLSVCLYGLVMWLFVLLD